jgi:hypothetical protein
VLILCALGQAQIQAAEDPAPIVIVDARMAEPADDASRWETSPPVQQAIAAARNYWSTQNPEFEENLRMRGSATGAFTRPDVEQHAVLFMMSNIPRCCAPMGLAIVEGERLVRNIAFDTIAQNVRAIPDVDGDGRNELAFGGSFVGQGQVTEGITLAAFGDDGLDDFGQAIIFESACGAGYGDTGALAARLSVGPGAEIIVEQFQQLSCDAETWESVGEPQALQAISDRQKTVYTEIRPGVTVTE